MPVEHLEVSPPKVVLVNLSNDEELVAQYNPSELEETIGAAYAKLTVPGYSGKVKQFTNTEDLVETFTLRFSSQGRGVRAMQDLQYARIFLMSLCYPRGTDGPIAGAGAPRVLFIWPNFISLTCVVTNIRFSHSQFNKNAHPSVFTAALTLEEMRDTLLLCDDVMNYGTERAP